MVDLAPVSDRRTVVDRSSDAAELLDALTLARNSRSPGAIRAAEQSLVIRFRTFAAALAAGFLGRGADLEDLVQVAQVGLTKAVRGWKAQPTGGFLQYARPMIVGELKRYFRDVAPMIRLPRHLQEVGTAVAMARGDLSFLRRVPTPDELAEAAGVARREVDADAIARCATDFTSLDAAPFDAIAPPSLAAERELDAVEVRTMLREAIACLTERERHLLALRYFQDLTQDEIGLRIGVSQMQVSRLLRCALSKLQQRLAA